MKTLRKTISLILILCICLSCFVTAHAAGSNLRLSSSATSVKVGDTVTVTVTLNGNPEVATLTGGFRFDKNVFEAVSVSNGNASGASVTLFLLDANGDPIRSSVASTVAEANSKGTVGFAFSVNLNGNEPVSMRYSCILSVQLRAKAEGSCSFVLYEDTATYPAGGANAFKSNSAQTITIASELPTYTVSFDIHGHGTQPESQTVKKGGTATNPGNLSAEGWEFGGWFADAGYGSAFDFGTAINGNTTIHAKWTKVHVHTLVKTEAAAADCTNAGHTEYWTCTQCGKLFSDAEGKTEISQPATVVAALGHSWDEGKHTVEPTCTAGGTKEYTCTRCGEKKTEEVAALGHDWDNGKYTKEPTCTEDGTKVITCTRCSETKTEKVGPLGHDYPAPRYTWSRDLSKVSASVTCSRSGCGHTVTETVPTEKRDDLAVCGQPGRTVYTASFSNALFTKQTKEIKTAVTPHTLVHYDSEDVGCGEPGRREYWYCSVCGKYFADKDANTELKPEDLTVEAVGHKFKEPVWTWSEDFGFASVKLVCERCNEEFEADGQITKNGNMRVATAKIEEIEYKGYKYIDAPGHSVSLTSAKDPEGKTVKVEITDTTDEDIMTSEKAVLVQHEILKGGEAKDVNVLWQRGVEIPFGTGGTEVSFTVSGSGIGKQLLAYRLDPERGWELVGYANDTSIITIKLDDGGQIALAERPYKAPEDDKKTPDPAVVPKNGGNLKKWLLIGGAVLAVAAIAVLIIFLLPGKNKHYKKR